MAKKVLKELTIEDLYTYYKLLEALLNNAYNKRLSFEGVYDNTSMQEREKIDKEIKYYQNKNEIILNEINKRINEI